MLALARSTRFPHGHLKTHLLKSRGRLLTTSTPPTASSRRGWGSLATITAGAVLSTTAYTIGSIYPPTPLSILFPRAAPAPPDDPTSPESLAYTDSLEKHLQNIPLLQSLRQQIDKDEWYEARPYQNFPEERRVNNLTAGALRGPGKLALPPLVRVKRDESEGYAFIHLGRGLCGHDGIIHGGLLATLLDETLARVVSTFCNPVWRLRLERYKRRLSITCQTKSGLPPNFHSIIERRHEQTRCVHHPLYPYWL